MTDCLLIPRLPESFSGGCDEFMEWLRSIEGLQIRSISAPFQDFKDDETHREISAQSMFTPGDERDFQKAKSFLFVKAAEEIRLHFAINGGSILFLRVAPGIDECAIRTPVRWHENGAELDGYTDRRFDCERRFYGVKLYMRFYASRLLEQYLAGDMQNHDLVTA